MGVAADQSAPASIATHPAANRDSAAMMQAIGEDFALLARLHDRELDAATIAALRALPVANWFALRLEGAAFEEAARLFEIAFEAAPDPLTQEALDEMAAEYAAIYLTHAYSIAPVESVWVDEDGLERQEPMFRVREWYSRFGFEAPDWRKRSDDHIAHELAFLSNVSDRLSDPAAAQGVARFLTEHPLVWFHDFAARVTRRCQSPFYAALALMTAAYLDRFADMLGRLYGFDMTPKPPRPPQAQPGGPTCGDAPPRFVPGAGPGW